MASICKHDQSLELRNYNTLTDQTKLPKRTASTGGQSSTKRRAVAVTKARTSRGDDAVAGVGQQNGKPAAPAHDSEETRDAMQGRQRKNDRAHIQKREHLENYSTRPRIESPNNANHCEKRGEARGGRCRQ